MAQYTILQAGQINEIATNYGLSINNFNPIKGGNANSSFLLHTADGKFVLTLFNDKSLSEMSSIAVLLQLFELYDFPTTQLYPASNGDAFISYLDKPVLLKKYIEGQVCNELNNTMLQQVGNALARLHQIPPPENIRCEHPYGMQLFGTAVSKNIDPDFELWLAGRISELEKSITVTLPRAIIHGDLFYDNILFLNDKLTAIIDFEDACNYYRIFDLGMAIVGLCNNKNTIDMDKARALVAAYQQIQALEINERNALQLFTIYAATATAYWRYWNYNIQNPVQHLTHKNWEMVHLANYIQDIPHKKFMEAVLHKGLKKF